MSEFLFDKTTETVEAIVSQLLEKQRTARLTGSLDCSCPDSTCLDSKTCIHQAKQEAVTASSGRSRSGRTGTSMMHHRHVNENNNQVNTSQCTVDNQGGQEVICSISGEIKAFRYQPTLQAIF